MKVRMRIALLAIAAAAAIEGCAPGAPKPELRFSIIDGRIQNDFIREGPVAAHVVLKSGGAPRLIVAFPAGNSGVGVWFDQQQLHAEWRRPERLQPISQTLPDGGMRHGVRFETGISAHRLEVRKAILSNIRVLRDYGYSGRTPAAVDIAPTIKGRTAVWERRRIDGATGYFLSIEAINGIIEPGPDDAPIIFSAAEDGGLRLRVTTLTGDTPLTGIMKDELLTDKAGRDQRLRDVLAFLAYEEKFLAGSWQYDTYFGRDTLMSLALLGTALSSHATEAGIASVLERLSSDGEVAHEEDIGEYALLRRGQSGDVRADDSSILDYKMIDDDFMLAPVLARYLLDAPRGRERASAFLSRRSVAGVSYRDLVRLNLAFVVNAARPYGEAPHWSRLIQLRSANPPVGNWRDSNTGLGGGVYPYDVNVALVPAALAAAQRLSRSGLVGDDEQIDDLGREAGRLAAIWSPTSAAHFEVKVDAETARRRLTDTRRRFGLDANIAEAATPDDAISFPALALDATGAPIPVMHSDVGFKLLFGDPTERELEQTASLILRPFPEGLMTPVGMVIANPAYAPIDAANAFGPDRYHGAVVWSWHHALMATGLDRQLRRKDLTEATRSHLAKALRNIEGAIRPSKRHRSSELWSWTTDGGSFVRAPFGQRDADETEANAAQLWSIVFLAEDGRRHSSP